MLHLQLHHTVGHAKMRNAVPCPRPSANNGLCLPVVKYCTLQPGRLCSVDKTWVGSCSQRSAQCLPTYFHDSSKAKYSWLRPMLNLDQVNFKARLMTPSFVVHADPCKGCQATSGSASTCLLYSLHYTRYRHKPWAHPQAPRGYAKASIFHLHLSSL